MHYIHCVNRMHAAAAMCDSSVTNDKHCYGSLQNKSLSMDMLLTSLIKPCADVFSPIQLSLTWRMCHSRTRVSVMFQTSLHSSRMCSASSTDCGLCHTGDVLLSCISFNTQLSPNMHDTQLFTAVRDYMFWSCNCACYCVSGLNFLRQIPNNIAWSSIIVGIFPCRYVKRHHMLLFSWNSVVIIGVINDNNVVLWSEQSTRSWLRPWPMMRKTSINSVQMKSRQTFAIVLTTLATNQQLRTWWKWDGKLDKRIRLHLGWMCVLRYVFITSAHWNHNSIIILIL